MSNQPSFGAMIPPSLQWQIGKTAASIQFVSLAGRFLQNVNLTEHERKYLEGYIATVKSGKVVMSVFVTEDDIWESLRNLKNESEVTHGNS